MEHIPEEFIKKVRLPCSDLPEVIEETAWEGIRWVVRKKNFAQLIMIRDGYPPAYAKAAKTNGPTCVLTFRLMRKSLSMPRFQSDPFFRPVWFRNIVGMKLDSATNWDDVAALLTESYCVLAPKTLVDLVENQ